MSKEIDFLKGAALSTENSKRLVVCADVLAATKEFGPANSLLILAIEEAVKAAYLFCLQFVEGELEDSDELLAPLRIHSNKHYFGFITQQLIASAYSSLQDDVIVQKFAGVFHDVDPSDTDVLFDRLGNALAEFLTSVFQSTLLKDAGESDTTERRWWRAASMQRNIGFYVDYDAGNWRSPDTVLEDTFSKTRALAVRLLEEFQSYKVAEPEKLRNLQKLILDVKSKSGFNASDLPDKL